MIESGSLALCRGSTGAGMWDSILGWGRRCSWLLLLVACVNIKYTAAARACEESGYCSVGISKPFTGDIKDSAQLRAMLEAVTYKKELIITIFRPVEHDLWIDQALQLYSEVVEMGYAHFIFVVHNQDACRPLLRHAHVNCVWDSSDFPRWILKDEEALWHNRWKLMARATRLGYNVMSIDTDFLFFRDPYVHLKSSPFNKVQLLGVPEGIGMYNLNGGFMYVQNARPDGPVTWVWKQVAMSTLRRADDHYKYMAQWVKEERNCHTFDQAIILDALFSAAVGRSVFPTAVRSCKPNASFFTRANNSLATEEVAQNVNALSVPHLRVKTKLLRPDPEFLKRIRVKHVAEFDSQFRTSDLTVPNLAWGYAEELGGRFAPPEMGQFSSNFTNMLKEDCPECPWWPEHRPLPPGGDPLVDLLGKYYKEPNINKSNYQVFYDLSIRTELMAQLPNWLVVSLGIMRRGWVLGKTAPVQGPMVLGHVHGWHMQVHRSHKAMVRKVYGRYNWTLGFSVARSMGQENSYSIQKPVTRVLALSPELDLSRTRSWEELSTLIAGLIQVAYLSQRVLLIPDLPCQTAWIHDPATVNDPESAPGLCIAPTFWRTPQRYPIPVMVAVDVRGELVGGWARRMKAVFESGGQPSWGTAVLPPLIVHPDDADEENVAMRSDRVGGEQRKLLSEALPDDWWARQRYVAVMPPLWDATCTKDYVAIISPEFHHWLKHSDEGKRAELKPTASNTAFRLSSDADKLHLFPPPPPGGDSAAVPAGSVVLTSNTTRWSWYDVQAALPVGQVFEHMNQFADQPLVYLGHPIMVHHNTTHAGIQTARMEQDARMGSHGRSSGMINNRHDGKYTIRMPAYAHMLSAINHHIRKGACKGVWVEPETHNGKVIDLNHGEPAQLVNGLVTPTMLVA